MCKDIACGMNNFDVNLDESYSDEEINLLVENFGYIMGYDNYVL